MSPLEILERDLLRRALSPATVRNRLRSARAFLAFAGKRPRAIRRDDVRRYLASRSRVVVASTQRGDLMAVFALYRALRAEGVVEHDPTEGLYVRLGSPRPPILLCEAAVGKLLGSSLVPRMRCGELAHALALRDRACLELLYGAGLRDSEARAARLADLRIAQATLLVRRAKRGPWGEVPLPQASLAHLTRYLAEARPALVVRGGKDPGHFLLTRTGRPLDKCAVWRVVKHASKLSGVRAHPHAFRRAVATGLVRAGVPVAAVKALLGHARLKTVACYVQVEREDLRRTVEILERTYHE